ncbi:hypothetical protein AB0C34_17485 [Nocardia sp. NPDC049220]|uniref:hypothetical protein n=1 Tax=Nocardia sp. NPDC049220 TaxID=3155273 RepID=UPI0033FA62EE
MRLTGEQAAALILPDGRFTLRGDLVDGQGWPVTVSELRYCNVPECWLRPADGRAPKAHMDLDTLNRWGLR